MVQISIEAIDTPLTKEEEKQHAAAIERERHRIDAEIFQLLDEVKNSETDFLLEAEKVGGGPTQAQALESAYVISALMRVLERLEMKRELHESGQINRVENPLAYPKILDPILAAYRHHLDSGRTPAVFLPWKRSHPSKLGFRKKCVVALTVSVVDLAKRQAGMSLTEAMAFALELARDTFDLNDPCRPNSTAVIRRWWDASVTEEYHERHRREYAEAYQGLRPCFGNEWLREIFFMADDWDTVTKISVKAIAAAYQRMIRALPDVDTVKS